MGRKFKRPPLRIDREYCGFKIKASSWQELADAKERIDAFMSGREPRKRPEPISEKDCSPSLFEIDKPV